MQLILNSYGTSLKKENNLLVVENAEGKHVVNPADVKSIMVSKGARVSSDAVLLAIEFEIDLLFIDNTGKPQGRVWSVAYGSISSIRKNQIDFAFGKPGIAWIKELLREKLDNQLALLCAYDPITEEQHAKVRKAMNTIEDHKQKISQAESDILSDLAPSLRGWEGVATKRYFEALNAFLPEHYRFQQRSQHPALDAFNALLNYGYGILYGKIEGALIKAGIDPYVGVFHRDNYNRPVLVYDVIERYRVWIDYVVMQLCRQDAFNDECFTSEQNGSVLLDGLGKRIFIQAVNDYLGEIITINQLERSRENHIQQYAHDLAKKMLTL